MTGASPGEKKRQELSLKPFISNPGWLLNPEPKQKALIPQPLNPNTSKQVDFQISEPNVGLIHRF